MNKKIVLSAFLIAGLVAVVTLIACNRISQTATPSYEFITVAGERKQGWCDVNLEIPKCKSEFGVWYEVKQYGSIKKWRQQQSFKQKDYGTIVLEEKND